MMCRQKWVSCGVREVVVWDDLFRGPMIGMTALVNYASRVKLIDRPSRDYM